MKYYIAISLIPLSFAFANGPQASIPPGFEASQTHDDSLDRNELCKVSLYEDKQNPQKMVAIVQEQVDFSEQLAFEHLKKNMAHIKSLPKSGEQVAFNVNCKQ